MIPVIRPVTPASLEQELAHRTPLRVFRGLEIHSLFGEECPAVMQEIGRLREAGFRAAGAGRNVDCDLDALDFGPAAYRQLLAWDPQEREIVAVYRYQLGALATEYGSRILRTHKLFRYSASFDQSIRPQSIELGRSVVNQRARRRMLGLFSIWTGLHALLTEHPDVRYYFGNVSLYATIDPEARALIVAFLEHHYPAPEPVLLARDALRYIADEHTVRTARAVHACQPSERIRALRSLLRLRGAAIPPIIQSYMGLSDQVWFGQTARDADFGDALESGIVVPVEALRQSEVLSRFEPGQAAPHIPAASSRRCSATPA